MNLDYTPIRSGPHMVEPMSYNSYSPMTQQMVESMSYNSYSPMTQQMAAMPPVECPCPTCVYYKSFYMYQHDAGAYSPMVDQFTPYQPVYSPNPRGAQHSRGAPQHEGNWEEEFAKCTGSIVKTACSASGRSMLQNALKHHTPECVDHMLKEILADLETVALDQHGCHVLRSLLEKVTPDQLAQIMGALNETLVLNMCTLSQYTRRILQTLFERHQHLDLQTIVDLIAKNVQYLSATQQGCISLMRIFEQCTAPQKFQIIAPLLPMFADLATDQFGNYVVQCVVEHSEKHVAAKYILDHLAGSMLKLSCNKYASNVMEKIVTQLNVPAVRRVLLDELIFNPAAVQQLSHDGFGNFVIQAITESCNNPNEFKKICDRLRPAMLNSPYAHRIESKIRGKKQLHGKPTGGIPPHVSQIARTSVQAY